MFTTIRSAIAVMPLVLAGWFGVLAGTGLFSDEAPAQIVLFPPEDFLERLPENTSIAAFGDWSITVVSNEPDFVRRLYASGASLVLPSGLQGCGG